MRIILAIIIFLTTIVACNKSNSNSSYFKFQLNNVIYTFDSVVTWVDTSAGAYITSTYAANTKTKSYISIETQSNYKTLIGTYSHIFPQPSNDILVNFTVLIVSGQSYYSYAIEGGTFTFTIDNSTTTTIHGTFSGSLAQLNSVQNGNITNGQFEITYRFR
jgi:hypothetical protein